MQLFWATILLTRLGIDIKGLKSFLSSIQSIYSLLWYITIHLLSILCINNMPTNETMADECKCLSFIHSFDSTENRMILSLKIVIFSAKTIRSICWRRTSHWVTAIRCGVESASGGRWWRPRSGSRRSWCASPCEPCRSCAVQIGSRTWNSWECRCTYRPWSRRSPARSATLCMADTDRMCLWERFWTCETSLGRGSGLSLRSSNTWPQICASESWRRPSLQVLRDYFAAKSSPKPSEREMESNRRRTIWRPPLMTERKTIKLIDAINTDQRRRRTQKQKNSRHRFSYFNTMSTHNLNVKVQCQRSGVGLWVDG